MYIGLSEKPQAEVSVARIVQAKLKDRQKNEHYLIKGLMVNKRKSHVIVEASEFYSFER